MHQEEVSAPRQYGQRQQGLVRIERTVYPRLRGGSVTKFGVQGCIVGKGHAWRGACSVGGDRVLGRTRWSGDASWSLA
jgi:hypothetical protein